MDTYTDIYNTHTYINTTQLQYAQYLNECTVLLYEMSGCNVHVNEWWIDLSMCIAIIATVSIKLHIKHQIPAFFFCRQAVGRFRIDDRTHSLDVFVPYLGVK